ncbi:hypothetical protein HOF40_05095 [Candidatus Parcubacteria bacterium]|jgi:hypothetical protein|nr:hypothetical protein [Candidatus Parcubacteria bacterium]MBT3949432.1 hypothetical protein [Candidatus Parcubacteria bacterium]
MKGYPNKYTFFVVALAMLFFALPVFAKPAPMLANYYLDVLQNNSSFISNMARYDVLVLTPTQIAARGSVVSAIRKKNPDIIILAYVPSQSYNYIYSSNDILFKNMNVQDSWWLRDSSGKQISTWNGIYNTNMDHGWSRYLVEFCNNYITSLDHVDGIFFDMVSENISWANGGNVDMNGDGNKDSANQADALWRERTQYLLKYSEDNLNTDYIIINGSSHADFQKYVNGRMFETFPTPWENDGAWSTIMNNLVRIKKDNIKPNLFIFNSNTNNTGNSSDYKTMRFGITSSLLEDDVYSSFDYGDESHGQTWWYDEYDVDLGNPISKSSSKQSHSIYKEDVWRRNFENGISIVNSTNNKQTIDLGGEYEKIHGSQDSQTNDGAIVSEVSIPGEDGLLLLKTFETLNDLVFTNGAFLRFFRTDGSRVRNGFFVFEDGEKGGVQIAHIDIDNNGKRDLVVARRNKIMAWRDDGQLYLKVYPYGGRYTGNLVLAVGDLNGDRKMEIYVAPTEGHAEPIRVYTRYGRKMRKDFYPFGTGYTGGYTMAIGDTDPVINSNQLFIGSLSGRPVVSVFSYRFDQLYKWDAFESWFTGGVYVAAGDVDGDGIDEVVTGKGVGGKPLVKIFDITGKLKYPEFSAYSSFGNPGIDVRVVDVDFDGREDIVGVSEGAF